MKLLKASLIAAVIASVLNTLTYFVFREAFDFVVPMTGMPITLPAILTFSIVPPFVAAGVLWLAMRYTGRSAVWFVAVSALALIFFTVPVFTIGAPTLLVIVLNVMHLIVAVPTVLLLLRARRAQ